MSAFTPTDLAAVLFNRMNTINPVAATAFLRGLNSEGHWHLCLTPKEKICSFLGTVVAVDDMQSRLTLCPAIEDNWWLDEIMSDVFPAVSLELEKRYG